VQGNSIQGARCVRGHVTKAWHLQHNRGLVVIHSITLISGTIAAVGYPLTSFLTLLAKTHVMHFKNHAKSIHNYFLFARSPFD
jgi:hypothetical protein